MEFHSAECAMPFHEETSATEAMLVRNSDALAASVSSQKMPFTICNANLHDLLKWHGMLELLARLQRHLQKKSPCT